MQLNMLVLLASLPQSATSPFEPAIPAAHTGAPGQAAAAPAAPEKPTQEELAARLEVGFVWLSGVWVSLGVRNLLTARSARRRSWRHGWRWGALAWLRGLRSQLAVG